MRCSPAWLMTLVLLVCFCGMAKAAERRATLDRVASAVDGAESSHGRDAAMWRPGPAGPQGPMQVSAGAATDVGGGDRFDWVQNRAIGRAYLAQLYRRYGNWPDAVAAYNWGIGRMNAWVDAGRPARRLDKGVAAYRDRVLLDSGLCPGRQLAAAKWSIGLPLPAVRPRQKPGGRDTASGHDNVGAACADRAVSTGTRYSPLLVGLIPAGSYAAIDNAIERTAHDLLAAERR
jgi:Transglycosylase SLT domain